MSAPSPGPRLALTCGDPAGVGPEVIAAFLDENPDEAKDLCVLGPKGWTEALRAAHPELVTVALGTASFAATAGEPSVEGARIAAEALEEAAAGTAAGRYGGVVTAPVSKHWMQQAGFGFPGHTEFFAARWGGEPTMAFAGGRLRVVLLTWHVPLMEVPRYLTEKDFTRAVEAADFLGRALGKGEAPRIGVCGLNPHAGEDGLLGAEEAEVIEPILAKLRARHPGLSACQPGDTVFFRQLEGEFDLVIALYHDQGLAPLKTLEFDASVNLTLGLPHVRTSPDHGTAFALAGTGAARWSSLAAAVRAARHLATFTKA